MATEKLRQIVVTGSVVHDILFRRTQNLTNDFKSIDGQISLSLFAQEHEMLFGGTGANIAYTMALLGMNPVLLASLYRNDETFRSHLENSGIGTKYLHRSSEKTAVYSAVVDPDGNQIGLFGGGAMFDSESLLIATLLTAIPEPFVLISPHDPTQMLTQVRECVTYKLPMCFDVGQQAKNGSEELLREGIDACEILIANEMEMHMILDRLSMTKEDLLRIVPICITTLGAKGSLIEGRMVPTPISIGVAKIAEFVDPTGAGDAFRGGFLMGYLHGLPLDICGQMGAVSAAFAVEQFGGQEHHFTVQEYIERYGQNFGDPAIVQAIFQE